MTDAASIVLVSAISGLTTILGVILAWFLKRLDKKLDSISVNVDGKLTAAQADVIALGGEIRKLQPSGPSSETPGPGSGAPVMLDPATQIITTTNGFPKDTP
jgi:hypothetical protein